MKRKVTQITRKLKISEERYRQLIESSPDMVFLIDRAGKIRMANTSAAERLRIPLKKLSGLEIKELVIPEEKRRLDPFLESLFSSKVASLEIRLRDEQQGEMTVEFVAATLKSGNGSALLASCFARDLTRRKRMEQELISAERLATIGKMAAGVAHEVNNPIGIILAHTEDLISGELNGSEMDESLNAIRRNAIRAGNITRAILDQASSDAAEKTKIDLAKTVDACLYFLKPRLKKIDVIQNLKPDIHWVWGDENQLQQMFINLLLNAVESMNGEGTLRVSGTAHTRSKPAGILSLLKTAAKESLTPCATEFLTRFSPREKPRVLGLGCLWPSGSLPSKGGPFVSRTANTSTGNTSTGRPWS